ncbi:MAG: FkbM family methyltransferase [Desulfobulbus sp.]
MNAPLVELTYQVWKLAGRAIRVLDVGAAIGDTILLLHANLPEALSAFVCVEGDPEFFGYLSRNLSCLANGRLLNVLLSDREGPIPQLVRIHSGTASAQGTANSRATTLETEIVEDIDVIKIDVDGFDGRVLMGARDLLKRCHPAVIFEWHPILCQQTGNNWTDHFDVLIGCGYTKFVWYSKFGKFSHFTFNYSFDEVAALAEYCLGEIEADWHYDIIALHESIDIPLQSLARLEFAASRPSPY